MLKPNSVATRSLIDARERIADPDNWCTGMRWSGNRSCAIGALRVASGAMKEPISDVPGYRHLRFAALSLFNTENIASEVNDGLGHAAVMQMFDRAIEYSFQENDSASEA